MKITIVNTYSFGGAANACIRLHKGLLKENINSKLLLSKNIDLSLPNTFVCESKTLSSTPLQKFKNKIKKIAHELKIVNLDKKKNIKSKKQIFLESRDKRLEMFSFIDSNYDITENHLCKNTDIINLHWVANFLDWQTFFTKNTKPIVWTLHDQNPFLGGEHYAERFLGINEKGFPILREYTDNEIIESKKILQSKQTILKNVNNIHIVSPSKWLLNSSKNSEIFSNYPHYHIPYGFPTDIFKIYNKSFCREVLNIPQDKIVLLFVADSLESSRKGYEYLQKSLKIISDKYQEQIFLCAIGNNSNVRTENNILELGKISDERIMAIAYGASDVFIIPSLEDNLPNTMIEAGLCGTPVIGFPVGGILDFVEDGKNGYLCPEISVQSLKETIEKFLDNPNIFDREKIAKEAKEKYALDIQAKAYIQLYQSILNLNNA
jgi:glycosyltransferase involved in cell wall biosynthesis